MLLKLHTKRGVGPTGFSQSLNSRVQLGLSWESRGAALNCLYIAYVFITYVFINWMLRRELRDSPQCF